MLQIKDIRKTYKTGSLVQKALDGVSLNLRDNEFVAILGPSGSGKTTLLNIIGGLDRYDSGDLVINGISTKKYKDRDWDAYRNHTVGFVFQSYNLIPHQTVLSNVELALTISGISGKERRERAVKALEKVGLGEQLHKKPNQMSGGQMQRVALARALVNDPDILLADEPTGALDSETSLQVMDLLKEVARDRLVVMVTHNPELAEEYANRIVRVKDGKILEDTHPFEMAEESVEAVHAKMGKASMSFLTALALSFNNLRTKKARTFLVAFAGSIGIIGIALIMSLSNGVNKYIKDVEEDTLSQYPLSISKTSMDLTAMMGAHLDQEGEEGAEVTEVKTLTSMADGMSTNDLASLKDYFDSGESGLEPLTNAIEYTYGITPQIYRVDGKKVRQVCPDQTMISLGMGSNIFSSMMSGSSMETFNPLPENAELYQTHYDVMAGHWPENEHEMVVVLSEEGKLTDLALYSLGLKPAKELDELLKELAADEKITVSSETGSYSYDDFLGIQFKLISSAQYYSYDKEYDLWKDRSDNKKFVKKLVKKGEDLTIVGVVQPRKDSKISILTTGVAYPASLITHVMDMAAKSEVVSAQKAASDTDIFTGRKFGSDEKNDDFDMEKLFTIDEDAFTKAFSVDTSKMSLDDSAMKDMKLDMSDMKLEDLLDTDALKKALPSLDSKDIKDLTDEISIGLTEKEMSSLFNELLKGYKKASGGDPSADPEKLEESLKTYLTSKEVRDMVQEAIAKKLQDQSGKIVSASTLTSMVKELMEGYPAFAAGQSDPTDFDKNFAAYLSSSQVKKILKASAGEIQKGIADISFSDKEVRKLLNDIAERYPVYASEHGLVRPENIEAAFDSYIISEDAQKLIKKAVEKSVDTGNLDKKLKKMLVRSVDGLSKELGRQLESAMTLIMTQIGSEIQKVIGKAMQNMFSNMGDMFSIDPDAFAQAFTMNMDQEDLAALMTSLMSSKVTTYESNLQTLGYAEENDPTAITIYPKDFDSKMEVEAIIDDYNQRAKDAGQDEKEITYTDLVGVLMSSVTDIINTLTYVLIAFVAISLVVSSIMIGVITYISVLERRKEIGILRSIGASKHNIKQVFNAETFITGLLAGSLGIGITELLLIPTNVIIHQVTGNTTVKAILPLTAAGLLILLSIVLTLLSGLIPAGKASRQDPVTALRTE